MSYLEKATQLYAQIDQGQMMEALEAFYHDDCVVVEATGEVRNGKAAQKDALVKWSTEIVKEFHGGGTTNITANEDTGITCVESWVDITMADGNRIKMEEVAVQKWKDGKIAHERFYYNAPGQ